MTISISFLLCSFRPDPTRRISLLFRLFQLCLLRDYLTQAGLFQFRSVGCVRIRVGSILLASSTTSSSLLPLGTGRRRRRGNSGAASLFSLFLVSKVASLLRQWGGDICPLPLSSLGFPNGSPFSASRRQPFFPLLLSTAHLASPSVLLPPPFLSLACLPPLVPLAKLGLRWSARGHLGRGLRRRGPVGVGEALLVGMAAGAPLAALLLLLVSGQAGKVCCW